ncbi:hypothetical protein [Fodinicola acaciae]|uniref:hypothetical protein n=1 Tax=Fodinicola acaciae TaxID=2681555 RepID=UPI0013D43B23|nr:hypothetical protein [Fodinicola acaciae]
MTDGVRRIPESASLVVRPHRGQLAILLAIAVLVLAVWILNSLPRFADLLAGRGVGTPWSIVSVVCVAVALAFTWCWLRLAMRGPMLAADDSGLWLRRTVFSAKAVFVPWESVRHIRPYLRARVRYVAFDTDSRWPWDGPLALMIRQRGAAVLPVPAGVDPEGLLARLYELSGRRVPVG